MKNVDLIRLPIEEADREKAEQKLEKVLSTVPDTADLTIIFADADDEQANILAAKSGKTVCADVDRFEEIDGRLYAVRSIYSTHCEELIPADKIVATVLWKKPAGNGLDLSAAKIVLLGGKGLGSKQNYLRMEEIAHRMGAEAACTRAVVLSGWTGYEKIVGISGWSLNADLCIALGVSGAGPLVQGLKNVKTLIAVNNDPRAAIFHYAQYGIREDCTRILDELEKNLEES